MARGGWFSHCTDAFPEDYDMATETETTCIVCEGPGPLVEHCREHMCGDCIPTFDLEVEIGRSVTGLACCVRCQGTGGDCCPDCEGAGVFYNVEAVPELIEDEQSEDVTGPTVVEEPLPMAVLVGGFRTMEAA